MHTLQARVWRRSVASLVLEGADRGAVGVEGDEGVEGDDGVEEDDEEDHDEEDDDDAPWRVSCF